VKEFGLTTKEREVLQYFIQGKTNAQIGEELVISESTVKKHLHNVYVKTKVKNRIQFMALLD
jgi:DNA-binding NarL/FixJ family response regulator